MYLLAIDSSTQAGSVALFKEEEVIAKSLLNLKQTQSQRLMPQIITLIEQVGCGVDDISAIGVGIGPGSFTGTRIGVATAKTLAQSLNIPIAGVSTLEAIASRVKYSKGYICALLNSNRNQLFAGLFYSSGKKIIRKAPDTLIKIDDLLKELKEIEEEIYFVGQFLEWKKLLKQEISKPIFTIGDFSFPDAEMVAQIAREKIATEKNKTLYEIKPNYLKKSQAEIEWSKRS